MGAPTILQSPPLANDDELERAQARAARAASNRRRSVAFSPPPAAGGRSRGNAAIGEEEEQPFLNHSQILDLFQNCIKLASENKINQKNTWDLGLIDHLSEIIKVRSKEDDDETNFQKASCTLEAGVKIYSLRVDSVHSEAYKVLGGINRAGREQDAENVAGSDNSQTEVEDLGKKELGRKLSPLSTLESSYEALNVKKFDVAFTVDPLYHQTSAQFDEGGAKGLLLNNLGVYGGCRVLFDSFESPEKNISSESQNDTAELIDLSFAKDHIEQMMINIPVKKDISPTLMDIVDQFDEDNKRSSNVFPVVQEQALQGDIDDGNHSEVEGNGFDDCRPWNFDQDDHTSVMDGNFTRTDGNFTSHAEEYGDETFRDPNVDSKFEKIAGFLSLSLGFTSKSNAWAGPDHWKFRKAKGLEQVPCTDDESEVATKKIKTKRDCLILISQNL
ncbi:condensin complex subunit 2-like isoform X1 [Iris pallida]|uniref:Condensin complex subunit 2 n=1 Tax=Iris pallida TaxID=29817 RepID=A0AAX6EI20_IRIPA|nr:condensin complex subunit 2-like isoform X1 [Iris pallida]